MRQFKQLFLEEEKEAIPLRKLIEDHYFFECKKGVVRSIFNQYFRSSVNRSDFFKARDTVVEIILSVMLENYDFIVAGIEKDSDVIAVYASIKNEIVEVLNDDENSMELRFDFELHQIVAGTMEELTLQIYEIGKMIIDTSPNNVAKFSSREKMSKRLQEYAIEKYGKQAVISIKKLDPALEQEYGYIKRLGKTGLFK